MGNEKWEMGNREWGMGNGEWGMEGHDVIRINKISYINYRFLVFSLVLTPLIGFMIKTH